MRLSTVVLVGYGAEDAVMRLLLETLDADRERFRDLKSIYAIDKAEPGSSSLWVSKGIRPIEFVDHDLMYSTLSEWSIYAINPSSYRHSRIRAILTQPVERSGL